MVDAMRSTLESLFFVVATCGAACSEYAAPSKIPEERHAHTSCVDFAIAATHDDRIPSTSILLDVEVENHCGSPQPLDLEKLDLWVETASSERHSLTLYDPRHEIVPLHIDGHGSAFERIRADGVGDDPALSSLCFAADATLGLPKGSPHPICFPIDAPSATPWSEVAR